MAILGTSRHFSGINNSDAVIPPVCELNVGCINVGRVQNDWVCI